ncbi:hypothetical protein M8C13_43585 [Crossiella sp. SN42]|uniref:hypothetical protein n=1 Tax=unclassified Crossiella TaxID=2620835 RepID=UPI00207C2872|nr:MULTISPECIES: hypothetical protein [unclassified Crossiella]MCO1582649.1 hypothetical protein [Crossiella sp. SN42]WHT20152.1 hypothetical protein N8J89_03510 [Crossiella sp. CA-258035]
MTGYQVVPAALRANVKFLLDAADSWDNAHKKLHGKVLSPDDLGLLGKLASVPDNYNQALESVLKALKKGFIALDEAGKGLGQVANEYESKDAKFYRKFGYEIR